MFQNITSSEEDYIIEEKSKFNIREFFSLNDIILYIITFMISMVGFNGNLVIFGLAMFAGICSNQIPAGVAYIAAGLGTLVGFGFSGFLSFIMTSIVFIGLVIVFRPIFQEEREEKLKLGTYIFVATFLVQAAKMFFTGFLVYDLLSAFMQGAITYIFYKIFANSINVIKEYGIKQVFSIEEIIGAALVIAITLVSLKDLQFWGLSITNIFSVMLVLFLGWKNGMLIGGTAGITIGMVLGIITASSPVLVASYAISGLIAGLLNRLGKIGVIVGFCIGNAILTYVANGNTVPIITIREILVASLGLLILPKDIKIDISEMIPQNKCFPVSAGILDGEKEAVDKLNRVSETISDMAKSYNSSAKNTLDEETEIKCKEIFAEDLLNNIEDLEDNFIYEDIVKNEENVIRDIYKVLVEEEEISKQKLLKILENNNDYIFGQTGESEEEVFENDVKEIVKIINSTYRVHKLNMVWKLKEANNKKILANQLGGVSKAIASLADDIEEKVNNIENGAEKGKKEPKFKLSKTVLTVIKNKSEVSGDSSLDIELKDGKQLLAISDGMGSGEKAKESSQTVINMLEKLLKAGFDKDISIGLINSAVNLNSNSETYATIDLSIVDLENGNIEFVKNGACPTFIKSGNKVEIVKAISLPAGMLDKIDLVVYDKDLKQNDIIVMLSDGILESNTEYENKELWVKNLLEGIDSYDIQKIARILMQESIDNGFGIAKDDMTIIVAKLENLN